MQRLIRAVRVETNDYGADGPERASAGLTAALSKRLRPGEEVMIPGLKFKKRRVDRVAWRARKKARRRLVLGWGSGDG
jgi:hypothetical protein